MKFCKISTSFSLNLDFILDFELHPEFVFQVTILKNNLALNLKLYLIFFNMLILF